MDSPSRSPRSSSAASSAIATARTSPTAVEIQKISDATRSAALGEPALRRRIVVRASRPAISPKSSPLPMATAAQIHATSSMSAASSFLIGTDRWGRESLRRSRTSVPSVAASVRGVSSSAVAVHQPTASSSAPSEAAERARSRRSTDSVVRPPSSLSPSSSSPRRDASSPSGSSGSSGSWSGGTVRGPVMSDPPGRCAPRRAGRVGHAGVGSSRWRWAVRASRRSRRRTAPRPRAARRSSGSARSRSSSARRRPTRSSRPLARRAGSSPGRPGPSGNSDGGTSWSLRRRSASMAVLWAMRRIQVLCELSPRKVSSDCQALIIVSWTTSSARDRSCNTPRARWNTAVAWSSISCWSCRSSAGCRSDARRRRRPRGSTVSVWGRRSRFPPVLRPCPTRDEHGPVRRPTAEDHHVGAGVLVALHGHGDEPSTARRWGQRLAPPGWDVVAPGAPVLGCRRPQLVRHRTHRCGRIPARRRGPPTR